MEAAKKREHEEKCERKRIQRQREEENFKNKQKSLERQIEQSTNLFGMH